MLLQKKKSHNIQCSLVKNSPNNIEYGNGENEKLPQRINIIPYIELQLIIWKNTTLDALTGYSRVVTGYRTLLFHL